ncbi:MAG: RagB/SusD family nutrient uptake outer membrane protein [Bacteroidetes bacterium]|nr:RagB/SusD family nutrient uptake outer membrane protein [Bacteroidota bacterium]
MKKRILFLTGLAAISLLVLNSCNKDLNRPPTNSQTSGQVYSTADGYKLAFAKVYGSFALTGNNGAGSGDIQGIDAGTSDFFRLFWKAQELSTDEAVVAWGDAGIQDFHNMNWSSGNQFLTGLYYRSMYQITLANDFIRQCADGVLSGHGIGGADADKIRRYKAEARFLRAYQYWVLMDLYGNPPFATDSIEIGTIPKQIQRADLFKYIESELKAIDGQLAAPKTNDYGRADQAADWALLARMYLNAEVYTGTPRYTDAITYAKKVIAAGYTLVDHYNWLMLADNWKNANEFILTINYDGLRTQNYGGTTFLNHASIGGSMNANDYGAGGGWGGLRTTKSFADLFPSYSTNPDKRGEFYTNGQNVDISNQSTFTDGLAITKYSNKTRTGANGSSLDFSDIDMPIFRLPEMYLIYAESLLRGGTGGDNATALGYLNKIRERAYENTSGDITSFDLNYILDERGRELYWEGYRRTDLIRYGRFTTSSYIWPWKGGVKSGTAVSSYRNLYPLPSKDLSANPYLKQNTGY